MKKIPFVNRLPWFKRAGTARATSSIIKSGQNGYWGKHKFLYWYQKFLRPVELLYFSEEKSTTVEQW